MTRRRRSKKCTDAGKPGVSVSVFPDQNGVNLALRAGGPKSAMADTPVAAYAVKQSDGKFKISGSSYGTAPYGIAMAKDSGLQQPVLAAVKALMADGTYKKILDYWGSRASAISNPTDQRSDQLAGREAGGVTPGAEAEAIGPEPPDEIKAVPVRHLGRWIAAAIVLLIGAAPDPLGGDQRPLRVERGRRLPVRQPDPRTAWSRPSS